MLFVFVGYVGNKSVSYFPWFLRKISLTRPLILTWPGILSILLYINWIRFLTIHMQFFL